MRPQARAYMKIASVLANESTFLQQLASLSATRLNVNQERQVKACH